MNAADARAWCLFQSGDQRYAVGLEAVAEIVETDHLVRLPLSPHRVHGFLTFRRDVVPVIRLAEPRLDEVAVHGLIVLVLRTEHGFWGLSIDRAGATVVEEVLADHGASSTLSKAATPVLMGTIRRAETAHAVIDPEPTWRQVREEIERGFSQASGRAAGLNGACV